MAQEKTNIEKIIYSSYYGVSRGTIGFFAEHPLELIKTRLQANLGGESAWNVVAKIYKQNGPIGFYKGMLPNFGRMFTKQVYLNPMQGGIKYYFKQKLPKKDAAHIIIIKNTLAGTTMAHLDSFVICPLERMKTWHMTRERSKQKLFMRNNSLFKVAFEGFNTYYVRSHVAWISFLVVEELLRNTAKKISNDKNPAGGLKFFELMFIGIIGGSINTALTMPFDVGTTQIQKVNGIKNMTVLSTMKYIVHSSGFKALYTGWRIRLLQYIINTGFSSAALQKIDQLWDNDLNHINMPR